MVVLTSLFVYPGLGHFMVKRKKQGIVLAVVFSLSLVVMLFEVWILIKPILATYTALSSLEASVSQPTMPSNLGRIALWVLVSTVIWGAGGAHCGMVASAQAADSPEAAEEAPKVEEPTGQN